MRSILSFARNCWVRTVVWDGALSWWSCDTVHAKFFRQNPMACPITNSHLLSNVVIDPTSILTDELLNSCNSFRRCEGCGSPCAFVIVNWCTTGLETGMPLKHLRTTQDLVPEGLLNHCEGLCSTGLKIGTKFVCTLHVPFSDPSLKSPQVTYTTPNKRVWKLPTSTQLRATWHNNSLYMVVISCIGASRYQNCYIDGCTSPEYFRYQNVKRVLLFHIKKENANAPHLYLYLNCLHFYVLLLKWYCKPNIANSYRFYRL
jgi:hypothetical protein